VEHGLPRPRIFLVVRVLLILFSFSIGGARAERGAFARIEDLLAEGRTDEARAELERLSADHEGSDLGSDALYRLNDLERNGAAYLERLARLAEEWNDVRVWRDLGRYRYAVGAYAAAAADFERASRLAHGEESLEMACWRGAALVAAGSVDDGLDLLFSTARERRGGEAPLRARYLAAEILARDGDLHRAADEIEPLLRVESDFREPARRLAAEAAAGRAGGKKAPGEEAPSPADRSPVPQPGRAESSEEVRGEEASGLYYVQVGSFGLEANALRFVAAERAKGIGAIEIHETKSAGKTYYQVRVGPFRSEEEARTAEENLRRGGLDGRVVRGGAEG
jgi:tetratricopeptide (TPR) repeat protein